MIDAGQFAIFGDWDNTLTPEGKLRIIMPPVGRIYGSGWHKPTQAGLRTVAEYMKPGMTFAEIGAGTAILSIAAKLMGASKCYALEINPETLAIARKVIDLNQAGDVIELIEGTWPPEKVDLSIVCVGEIWSKENADKIKTTGKIVFIYEDTNLGVERWI